MAAQSTAQPIIIIRKKVSHEGGHHGGAWKVAYADFVTAMMALFIVLWLMASSDQVKKSIASYFLDPQGRKHEIGSGGLNGSGQSMFLSVNDMQKLKEKLQQALRSLPAIEKLKDQITMTITGEGLRIELVENSRGVFFESGNAKPTSLAVEAIGVLAGQLGQLPNPIVIEGHTDAASYSSPGGYTNWELSSDRANEARRLMQAHGVRLDQIKQIRGYADQSLRNTKDPLDPSNRRISVIVLYGEQPATPAVPKTVAGSAGRVPAEVVNASPQAGKEAGQK
ncbi:MAG: OmpA family protein [Acidobacteriota bacterium]|nr:OmpA family protein [Acidobacteriota bacterium]